MRILITGGKGQLGRSLTLIIGKKNLVMAPGKEELDVTSIQTAQQWVRNFKPDIIIHAGALTDIDLCQKRPELAFKINSQGTRNMAMASLLSNAIFVYISTNYVFKGRNERAYREEDAVEPVNVYGASKLLGEDYIHEFLDKYFIIRTSWLFGQGNNNFVQKMVRLLLEKERVPVVSNQFATPTYTQDLAWAINLLINSDEYGIYHLCNGGDCSRYQWVVEIARILRSETILEKVDDSYFKEAAPRPLRAILDTSKFSSKFGLVLRPWQDALQNYLQKDDFLSL